jgi:hypothetical protein
MFNFTLLLIITVIVCIFLGLYMYYHALRDCNREIQRIEMARIVRERRYRARHIHPEFLSTHSQLVQTQQYVKEMPEIIVVLHPDQSMQIAKLITD